MPPAYQCPRCKGPPVPERYYHPCPHCGGFYRPARVMVAGDGADDEVLPSLEDDEPISAGDLQRLIAADEDPARIESGLPGVDYVLGGGLPTSGAVLLCAEEGAGKSTLLMELFRSLARRRLDTLYITAEQTMKDVGRQFAWLGKFPDRHMAIHAESDAARVFEMLERRRPRVAAIDSLHTVEGVTDADGDKFVTGGPAAVAQLARTIKRFCGEHEMLTFVVGHVTNDGLVAGGRVVRHMLDATLVLHNGATEQDPVRVLECQGKTRFGGRGRRARFEMTARGLMDRGPIKEAKVLPFEAR